jgi:DNA-binding transcriptional regulator YiaG
VKRHGKPKSRSKPKRNPNTEQIAKIIRHLRQTLPGDVSQQKFADLLGVRRTTVSSWDRAQNVPSVAVALRIAGLMPDPRRIAHFLDLVGVDQRATADVVTDLGRKHFVVPEGNQVAAILPAAETAGTPRPLKSDLLLQPELVGDPSSKRYFTATTGASTLGFEPGDLLLLDVSAASLRSPSPFWGKRVLVEFRSRSRGPYEPGLTYEVGRLELAGPYLGPSGNFYAAVLHRWSDEPPRTSVLPGLRTAARTVAERLRGARDELGAARAKLMEPSPTAENLGFAEPAWLGTWEPEAGNRVPSRKRGTGGPSEADRACASMRLRGGVRILGRVIGWIEVRGGESGRA